MQKIASAFIKAKKAFSPALKSNVNPHFKSKYADLATCLEEVNEALLDNGIAVTQKTHPSETGITVETIFIHESGETISGGELHVPAAKLDPQGFGSALSYARRYSLMAACGIAAEDDDGQAAAAAHRKQQRDQWLKTQFGRIDAAKTSGEMKAVLSEALAVAVGENDNDAIDQLKAKAQAKVEAAKPKTSPQPEEHAA